MEGLWAYNEAFVCVGIKEFNDGEVYEGNFKKNEYNGKVSTKLILKGCLVRENGETRKGKW